MTTSKKTSAAAAFNRPLPTNMFPSETRWSCSIWNECVQARIERLNELHGARPRLVLAISCRGQYSNKRRIRSVPCNRIEHEPCLSAVLACDHPPMSLIPIQNQVLYRSLLHQILIHNNRRRTSHWDRQTTGAHWLPTGAREAVLGRVNGFTSALALVVADIQIDRLSIIAHISAVDVVTDAERTYYPRLQWIVLAQPTIHGLR